MGVAAADFPSGPDLEITPGVLCEKPSEIRYPEKIKYCERNVSSQTKAAVIRDYDHQLGFRVGQMRREDFKIDHLIPLCAGGSNSSKNLWPQHKTIFALTDRLEGFLCEILATGKIKQIEVVKIIRRAKNNPDSAHYEYEELQRRF